jgi:hypothetical protein
MPLPACTYTRPGCIAITMIAPRVICCCPHRGKHAQRRPGYSMVPLRVGKDLGALVTHGTGPMAPRAKNISRSRSAGTRCTTPFFQLQKLESWSVSGICHECMQKDQICCNHAEPQWWPGRGMAKLRVFQDMLRYQSAAGLLRRICGLSWGNWREHELGNVALFRRGL